jgi:hypothetical protein
MTKKAKSSNPIIGRWHVVSMSMWEDDYLHEETQVDRFHENADRIVQVGMEMPGFAPTQGHIASALPFLGHAHDMLVAGRMRRVRNSRRSLTFLRRRPRRSRRSSRPVRSGVWRKPSGRLPGGCWTCCGLRIAAG